MMPEMEEMLTIDPPPVRRMAGIAYLVPRKTPVLFTAITSSHSPALILLDMGRLGLRGAALIAQVRRAGPAILPIVLMTTTPREARLLLVPGSIECLDKPFDIDDVLVRVARYVQPTQTLRAGWPTSAP